jgi:hypothetical protein
MDNFFEIIFKLGRTPDKIKKTIRGLPSSKLLSIASDLCIATGFPKKDQHLTFDFAANTSLSGQGYPCMDEGCRIRKAEELATFAALYADRVLIRDPFESFMFKGPEDIHDFDRWDFLGSILVSVYLKPLLDKGLVVFSKSTLPLCAHHHEKQHEIENNNIPKLELVNNSLTDEYLNKTSIIYNWDKEGYPFFTVNGPEDLVPHGHTVWILNKPPKSLESITSDKLPYHLNSKEIMDSRILSKIIDPLIDDFMYQETCSRIYGTKYLADSSLQINVSKSVNDSVTQFTSNALLNAISHIVPAITSQTPEVLLDLREKENEAFLVYRDALNKVFKASTSLSESELREMFSDVVKPELNQINAKVKTWEMSLRESVKERMIFGTATVLIGLYSGLLPPDMGKLIAALGGVNAVSNLLSDYNKTLKESSEARANNFYFLWKLSKLN